MRRGVVFMSCHNAIWEQAAALRKPLYRNAATAILAYLEDKAASIR
jgi:hypothetical protein